MVDAAGIMQRGGKLFKRLRAMFPRRRKADARTSAAGDPQPSMSADELACYAPLLAASKSVIEYGAGGSTLLALQAGVPRLISVETDAGWLDKLRSMPAIAQAEQSGRLTLIHVDIGPVGKWGRPIDASGVERYPAYSPAPWSRCERADLVLVDGRFRVAAALESLIHADNDTKIAFHDFWKRRHYHVVLPFVECLHRVDKLAVFRRHPSFDVSKASELLERYRSNFE